jgi:hypothetical protein
MTATNNPTTNVVIAEEREHDQVKRKGRFLLFFPTEWWETISERHIGNDLHIQTQNEIRRIFFNGKQVFTTPQGD